MEWIQLHLHKSSFWSGNSRPQQSHMRRGHCQLPCYIFFSCLNNILISKCSHLQAFVNLSLHLKPFISQVKWVSSLKTSLKYDPPESCSYLFFRFHRFLHSTIWALALLALDPNSIYSVFCHHFLPYCSI